LLLGIASSLSVFGMTIILPAISSIGERFGEPFSSVQFVVSAYLFGLAFAQPVSGFLCDRIGRRRVMLAGFAVFIVASLLCIVAPSLNLLIMGRFMQAVGASVGTVATRAILRDTRSGEQMAEAMSYVAIAMGIAPIIGPIFGGLLDSYFGYQSMFIVTALMGVAVLVGMFVNLEETLPRDIVAPRVNEWLGNYWLLLRSPQFVGFTLIYGFVQGAFFCFLAVGAPYFEARFGMDSKTYGFVWGLMALTYVFGATVAAKLTSRVGTAGIMRASIALVMIGGILVLFSTWHEPGAPIHILLPLGLLMFAAGPATPGSMAGAVRYHPEIAGTASGLSSAIGLVLSGSFTVLSGSLYDGRFFPIAGLIFVSCMLAGLSWLLASRPLPTSSPAST
jgi:DHA1 family bicyclomycin/chloramphenicol resistance-like MFS transporter